MGRTTIDDVAERAGVSKSTVSAVMNDSRPVSDGTRSKVMAAVNDLNYRPRSTARTRAHDGRSIGIVIKERDNPFFAEIADGASRRAREAGYTVYTASSEGDFATETEIIDDFQRRDTDGLIIYPVMNEETDLTNLIELRRARMPFVLMEHILGVKANTVDVSLLAASKSAVSYLIDSGHRRIVHFAGPSYSTHSDDRISGMRHAFSESELAFSDHMVVPAGARMEDGYRAALEYLENVDPTSRATAATCFNDLVAIGVARALREKGLDVPGDVSLIGCDGIDLLDYMPTPLTTLRSPNREMGACAADILIHQIEADAQPDIQQVSFEPELVVRASTRPMQSKNVA
ncbi:LacI family DNA-binding transcriptional regulator [Longibacter salinarum]|uniref:LacI family DNA-binding transcriptional regulator n=1 Tax=Longibacter salinarum TaxID=1850348 RepID=UPI001FE7D540|nr:LacI family DNA-binding transcriptional regulator [Longibacter salinarum]